MNLQPLLDSPLAVQIHVAAVLPAAVLGAYILVNHKGTPAHRLLGKIWMALMVITSFSSFFIHEINLFYGFSPIHLLSIFVLVGVWRAISAARAHNIRAHKASVIGMYIGGIVGAGLFTLIPGRIMNAVVFSGGPDWGLLLAIAAIAGLLFLQRKLAARAT
ncbi:DUF2306 domain-containing protein [Neorhizobium petrolearium]|uniref:DUF2306 domain-containing protein n=1 Tax=Neorhizobium petrolearium TaxID=515361 RepID=A0ABY8M8H3_9HYPH|nr:DUF2306 domain-containing protein [Neorhizobium petrolearium]MCC2610618.1 DUF2306 domain-containing protein [Neorhizobium petrolearium]WGI70754.1 DUF2306 domain-containing protein [Neorhizobium petrolearium]